MRRLSQGGRQEAEATGRSSDKNNRPVFYFYPLKALPSSNLYQKLRAEHSHRESLGDHSLKKTS